MSLIQKGSSLALSANKNLYNLCKTKIPMPSLFSGFCKQGGARHSVVKSLFLLNAGMFGGYLLMSGPHGLMYKKYFTMDANSSILSIPFCHFGNTNAF